MPESNITNPELRWFVLTVPSQHEVAVKERLEAKGYETSVPVRQIRRRWSDRWKTLAQPLFPGYVFCRFVAGERLRVLNTPGVRGAVTFASQLASLEDDEMERIHRMAASGLPVEAVAGLRTGARVRIIAGPLTGLQGVLAQANGASRVVLNIHLLNRSVCAEVDLDSIEVERAAAIPA